MQRKIAYGGMGAALCLLLLAGSVYLPTGKAALLFLSSLVIYMLTFLTDKKTALICYVAAAALSVVFTSLSSVLITLSFGVCFGNYPVLKCYIDTRKFVLSLIIKFAAYSVYFFAVYFSFVLLFEGTLPYVWWILYFAGVAVFAFYDILLAQTGRYVMARLLKRFL